MKWNVRRRDFLKGSAALGAAGLAAGPLGKTSRSQAAEPIKVGILHSLTGTIAIAEASVVDAEKLAIEEINAEGGVMGRKIEPIIEDGASDWPTFAEKARKLLERDKVACIFGCYTSASRKAVLPVVEKSKGLLYYPTYYEGLEQSPNIMYTAQEATQSVIAAVNWLAKNKGKSFYLIGSDYIWPRTTNKIAKPTDHQGGRQGGGRGLLPAGPHRVRLGHQQDQGGRRRTSSSARSSAVATSPSTSSSRRPASPARTRRCWRWRCPRRS